MNGTAFIVAHRDTARPDFPDNKLNVDGAARHLGVSRSFLNKMRVTGGGPIFFKVGTRVVYAVKDLDSWLDGRRRNSTADAGDGA